MRLLIVLTGLLFVGACATVPMAPLDDDVAGKQFEPAPPDRGVLYVFRESIFGAAFSLPVTAGQRDLGALAPDTWFRVALEPSLYEVRCQMENNPSVPVQLASGETRYVEASIQFGIMTPRCAGKEIDAPTARAAIKKGRRAQEIR